MNARIQQFGARRIATVILALGLVGVVAVPVINAASSGPAPGCSGSSIYRSRSSAGGAGAGQVDEATINAAQLRLGSKLLSRVVRGDFVVRAKGGTFVDIHYERGQISAVTATSLYGRRSGRQGRDVEPDQRDPDPDGRPAGQGRRSPGWPDGPADRHRQLVQRHRDRRPSAQGRGGRWSGPQRLDQAVVRRRRAG